MAFHLLDTRQVHIPRKSSRSFFPPAGVFLKEERSAEEEGKRAAVGQTNKRRLTASRDRPSRTACENLRLSPPGSRQEKRGKKKKNRHPNEEGHATLSKTGREFIKKIMCVVHDE